VLVTALAGCGLFGLTWFQEKRADLISAQKLHCAKSATKLVLKKRLQNWVYRKHANSFWALFVTADGNDLLKMSHPPITQQLKYMSELEQQQMEKSNLLQHNKVKENL
jgi:hypothetical protein